jgi:hypothetical protein
MHHVEINIYALPYLVITWPYYYALPFNLPAEAKRERKVVGFYITWITHMATTMLAILVENHNIDDHAQNGWISHVYNACIRHVKETY